GCVLSENDSQSSNFNKQESPGFHQLLLTVRCVFGSYYPPIAAPAEENVAIPKANFEIGRFLHLKAEIGRYRIGLRISDSPIYDFEISDLRCRNLPISKFALGTDIDRSHPSA